MGRSDGLLCGIDKAHGRELAVYLLDAALRQGKQVGIWL